MLGPTAATAGGWKPAVCSPQGPRAASTGSTSTLGSAMTEYLAERSPRLVSDRGARAQPDPTRANKQIVAEANRGKAAT